MLGSGGGSRGREVERERENPREKEGKGGPWRSGAAPGGHLGLKAASRRWSTAAMRRTRRCCLLEEEERSFFCRKPLGFGRFRGKIKTAHFCKILHFKWCAKILKFGRGFLEK
jgi:hypothetical protein